MKIGVLAVQGDFAEHLDTLETIGVEGVDVRRSEQVAGLSGLILPGGESTTMRRLIDRWGLRDPILELAAHGAPIFGTCAGMIVLSREIAGGEAPILPLLSAASWNRSRPTSMCRCSAINPCMGSSFGHPSSSEQDRTSTSWPGWTTAAW